MKKLFAVVLFLVACGGVSPWPPDWVSLDDGGIAILQPDGGLEPVLDAGSFDQPDAGEPDAPDAGVTCKPGNGWGDKNHCHCGPPGHHRFHCYSE